MMNFQFCLSQLENNAPAVQAMVAGVESAQARWKPDADSWSILEVINHLADEEREDFRARVQIMASGSGAPFQAIHPVEWVVERRYNDRDLAASLDDFLRERKVSLEWLRGLKTSDWNAVYQHPPLDQWKIRTGDLLVSWVAHDVLHLRQLVELKWFYQKTQFADYNPQYAGDW